jgi:hypothetical protein
MTDWIKSTGPRHSHRWNGTGLMSEAPCLIWHTRRRWREGIHCMLLTLIGGVALLRVRAKRSISIIFRIGIKWSRQQGWFNTSMAQIWPQETFRCMSYQDLCCLDQRP